MEVLLTLGLSTFRARLLVAACPVDSFVHLGCNDQGLLIYMDLSDPQKRKGKAGTSLKKRRPQFNREQNDVQNGSYDMGKLDQTW